MKCIKTYSIMLLIAIIGSCMQDHAEIASSPAKKSAKSYIIAMAALETVEDSSNIFFIDQAINLDLKAYTTIDALKKAIINNPEQYIFTDRRNKSISDIMSLKELRSALKNENLVLYTKEAAAFEQRYA